MEPDDVSDYSRQAYWDARYKQEPTYDWFSSIYAASVDKIAAALEDHAARIFAAHRLCAAVPEGVSGTTSTSSVSRPVVALRVLHLGTGNSMLPLDLARRFFAAHTVTASTTATAPTPSTISAAPLLPLLPFDIRLEQVCMDYSPVVIAHMREKGNEAAMAAAVEAAAASPAVSGNLGYTILGLDWQVGDIRCLERDMRPFSDGAAGVAAGTAATLDGAPAAPSSPPTARSGVTNAFDVIIDKGTMDALQADKENDDLDDFLDQMMVGVSRCLRHRAPSAEEDEEENKKTKDEAEERRANEESSSHEAFALRSFHRYADPTKKTVLVPGRFIQITWEIPAFRKYVTNRPEYGWGPREGCAAAAPAAATAEEASSSESSPQSSSSLLSVLSLAQQSQEALVYEAFNDLYYFFLYNRRIED